MVKTLNKMRKRGRKILDARERERVRERERNAAKAYTINSDGCKN